MGLNTAANLPIIETVHGTNVGTVALSSNTHWLASARARVGYAWNKWMVYGTGGAAWTDTSYNMTYTPAGVFVPPIIPSNTSFSQSKTGFVVGLGAEYMLTRNWLMRLEYLYYGFNGISGNFRF
jgi:outer membrane immunogenic protein